MSRVLFLLIMQMRQSDAELECSEWFFLLKASELLMIRDNYFVLQSTEIFFFSMEIFNSAFDVVTKYGHSNAIRHRRILNAIIYLRLTF